MKFRSLSLLAYGPFEGEVLDFSPVSAPGLHVVHGRNEAGKSTLRRAIRGLLFGIKGTDDAHRHATSRLRIGATLELSDGSAIELVRVKKNKDSLRRPDDQPLDESVLAYALGGVDETLFDSLYAFDHERLKLGGEALLDGKGAIGETLYDAALGGRGISRLRSALQAEADELYRKNVRAKKPLLNAALERYRQLSSEQRSAVVPPHKYLEQEQACQTARAEVERHKAVRRELRLETERLQRVVRLLAPFAKRKHRQDALESLGSVPDLPPDAAERRASAERACSEAEREIQRLERELAQRSSLGEAIVVDAALCEQSPALLTRLRDQIGSHRKAMRDLPAIQSTIRAAEDRARALLRQLGKPADVVAAERIRPSVTDTKRLRRLAQDRALVDERLGAARAKLLELQSAMALQRAKLEALAPAESSAALEQAVRTARPSAGLEARLGELLAEQQRRVAERDRQHAALQRWRGSTDDLLLLQLPEIETVDEVEARKMECDARVERAALAREEHAARLREVQRDIRALELEAAVPDESQLVCARQARDAAWASIKQAWQRAEHSDLQAFESALDAADEVADRLRREASRVAELARLRAAEQHLRGELERAQQDRQRATAELVEVESDWEKLWLDRGIQPGGSREMRSFLRHAGAAIEAARGCSDRAVQVAELTRERDGAARTLAEALRGHGITLGRDARIDILLERAEQALAELRQRELERKNTNARLAELEVLSNAAQRVVEDRERELSDWSVRWQAAAAAFELPESATPDEALAVLEIVTELFECLDALPSEHRRVEGIERDARQFSAEVEALVARAAPDLAGKPVDVAADELVRRYQEAQVRSEEKRRLEAEIVELRAELERQVRRKDDAEHAVSRLLLAAGAVSVTELAEVERRVAEARTLRLELRDLDSELLQLAGGASLDEIERELSGWDRARAHARLAELEDEQTELDEAYDKAVLDLQRKQGGLELYATQSAAEVAQQRETVAADVRDCLERYARAKLALTILESEIERYRAANQGPLLSRANQLFPRLTLGRFSGLRVGLEERVLRCVKAGAPGEELETEVCGLSEGTAYQLYFALWLATVERQLRDAEPVPLVLDDVLIHFDDERSEEALRILAELSTRTQILFFTHHARLVELARRAVPASMLHVHEIGAHLEPRPSLYLVNSRA